MSYGRKGPDSDLYIYVGLRVVCCSCLLWGGRNFSTETIQKMRDHVNAHIAAGHKVPADLLAELDRDVALEQAQGRAIR